MTTTEREPTYQVTHADYTARMPCCWPRILEGPPRVGQHGIFVTPWEQYFHRHGQPYTVVAVIEQGWEDADTGYWRPLYRIRFADGAEIDAWESEIGGGWSTGSVDCFAATRVE